MFQDANDYADYGDPDHRLGDGVGGNANGDYYDLDMEFDEQLTRFSDTERFLGCVEPTIFQFTTLVGIFVVANILLIGLAHVVIATGDKTCRKQHTVCMLVGCILLHYTYGWAGTLRVWAITGVGLLTYVVAADVLRVRRLGVVMAGMAFGVLTFGELLAGWQSSEEQRIWHRIRGSLLIVTMKLVSVGFDVEEELETARNSAKGKAVRHAVGIRSPKKSDKHNDGGGGGDDGYYPLVNGAYVKPSWLELGGYLLTPASCVFGPWVPFSDYMSVYSGDPRWRRLPCRHTLNVIANIGAAFVCLIMSNCLLSAWLGDPGGDIVTHPWTAAIRDAMSFRFSHYFVTFLGQALLLFNDQACSLRESPLGGSRIFGLRMVEPLAIELPRSLVRVVIVWNRSMHRWLKIYVFRVIKPQYGTFFAIVGTYSVSALLHGLNLQLAAVLLSLGLFSYVEHRVRQQLANIFDACILATDCYQDDEWASCSHHYKWNHWAVLLFNAVAGLLTMFNLAYLGVMFAGSSIEIDGDGLQEVGYSWAHTMSVWSRLYFASHAVMLSLWVLFRLV